MAKPGGKTSRPKIRGFGSGNVQNNGGGSNCHCLGDGCQNCAQCSGAPSNCGGCSRVVQKSALRRTNVRQQITGGAVGMKQKKTSR